MSRTVAIIQARMGSTRLPGKVLMPLGGETVLDMVVKRTLRAALLDAVVVATGDDAANDPIARHCGERGWTCVRGSEHDVLSRYCKAAAQADADIVVRITADCPLTDPALVDRHVERMRACMGSADIVTNMLRETYPLGLAVEVLPRDVLTRMDRLSGTAELREHVTTLAYERPELFLAEHVLDDVDRSWMRLTVDHPEDLTLLRAVFDAFADDTFTWREAAGLVERTPALLAINKRYAKARP